MGPQMKAIIYELSKHYANAHGTEKIIVNCALAAAGADAVGGIFPGLAVPATIASCFGAIWVMYGKLCSELGISLKENVLKLLARAALANIAANLGGALLVGVAGMFVPAASVVASAAICFATVYLAGIVFLSMISKMAEKSSDPHMFSDISSEEMEQTVNDIKLSKKDLKEAKGVYNQHKKQ